MKVAYLLDSFPRLSETFILNEILKVQEKGIDVTVISFSRPAEAKTHRSVDKVRNTHYCRPFSIASCLGAHIYWLLNHPGRYLQVVWMALRPKNDIFSIYLLRLDWVHEIYKANPDHIHAHFGGRSSNMAMVTKVLTGIPYTFTTHRYDIYERPPGNYRIKSRLAKKHITVSGFNRNYIIDRFKVDEKDIVVNYCGIDLKYPFPDSKNTEERIIITIARLVRQKGLDLLVRACHELKQRGYGFRCVIVGDGPEKESLTSLIRDLGLEDTVTLYGSATQEEVFELLSTSSLMVLPSRSESMGIALMEAMVMKVPVVGPKVFGVNELVEDGVNGYLVEPEDLDTLVKRISALLCDENKRKIFAEKAYNKVCAKFDSDKLTEILIGIWIR